MTTWAQRQPLSVAGTTNRPRSAAATYPNEKNPARQPTNQPRRDGGTNSARYGATITLSAPMPAPARMRATANTS